jgi:glycosyltransferase involved in cell wall biosynthesis
VWLEIRIDLYFLKMRKHSISVVTPTFRRPEEVRGLLENLAMQSQLPAEIILVDGAPPEETATELEVFRLEQAFPFRVNYIRYEGGTAIQRNVGIDAASGTFIALIDDDVRLKENFLQSILDVFDRDSDQTIGGVVGYRTNQYFELNGSERWRWYKRLKLLTTYQPGRYDFNSGYPINNNMQPPFTGTRKVDFMTTACAVWRRKVFDAGLRFHSFFRDYGVLEDAHLSLRAARSWTLLQCGDAHCEELHSPNGRVDRRKIGYKSVVNYYFVFQQIAGPLTISQKYRFWRYQAFEVFRLTTSALRRRNWGDISDLRGRLEGVSRIIFSGIKAE